MTQGTFFLQSESISLAAVASAAGHVGNVTSFVTLSMSLALRLSPSAVTGTVFPRSHQQGTVVTKVLGQYSIRRDLVLEAMLLMSCPLIALAGWQRDGT